VWLKEEGACIVNMKPGPKNKTKQTNQKHVYTCSPKCIYKQIHTTLLIIAPNSIKTNKNGSGMGAYSSVVEGLLSMHEALNLS
jgi:hypothetical protein